MKAVLRLGLGLYCLGIWCLTLPRCHKPTEYKTYNSYIVLLTTPHKAADNFYLIVTKNNHGQFGGIMQPREPGQDIILFDYYNGNIKAISKDQAAIHYLDFIDALNSDQPAHNVRVRAGDRYITLSKIFVREFRNGFGLRQLTKIVSAQGENPR